MSYNNYLSAVTRQPIYLVEMIMDKCPYTFGEAPCTAVGTKCYNTFYTCKNKVNYSRSTKTYKFISSEVNIPFVGVLPYVKRVNYIPAEIKEDKTIPARCTITMIDDTHSDLDVDPYWTDRGHTNVLSVPGTYWRRFIARNKNFKGRRIIIKQGFNGLPENEFQKRTEMRIENITYNGNEAIIEAADLLTALQDISYPLKTNIKIMSDMPKILFAGEEDNLINMDGKIGDYARVNIFQDFIGLSAAAYNSPGGDLVTGTYDFWVFAYDIANRAYAKRNFSVYVNNENSENSVRFDWGGLGYLIEIRIFTNVGATSYISVDPAPGYYIFTFDNVWHNIPNYPYNAEIYYKLTSFSSTGQSVWTEAHEAFESEVSDASTLDSSGYILIDKEIIQFGGKSGNVLNGLIRDTANSERHTINTPIFILYYYSNANPFNILVDMLHKAKIDDDNIDDSFEEYANEWEGIDFNISAIATETNLAVIFFNLVNSLDAKVWQSEESKIKIRLNNDIPAAVKNVSDATEIVDNSVKIDCNDKNRYTRVTLYYNKYDMKASITEANSYRNVTRAINADAESEKGYNEVKDKIYYSLWLNSQYGVADYVDTLLYNRMRKLSNMPIKIEFETELKDEDIMLGDFITITTNEITDENGNGYVNKNAQIIMREPNDNKIKFTAEIINNDE